MKLAELKSQLKAKERSIKDLLRFIETRSDQNPNHTLLLGAGCSVTSGVRSASALCNLWRREIIEELAPTLITSGLDEQQDWLKKNQNDWYDAQKEYSTLFERKYDLQRQRRMFVENEVKDAFPSIGYTYLTALIDQNYFNTVFTTNFDDLVNESFFLYSNERPIVCAHDSSINSVTITSKRPKIIKLHGDYLFDDIKATERETESLDQNMKEKFVEFAKDYGLIVIGYSGGDRSIMDIISLLLKNDEYFKNGLYWCIRKDSDVPEELRRLLWRERVYFVEIGGFDELMAEMYAHLSKGELIPPSTTHGRNRYDSVIKRLLDNPTAFPTTSENLRAAKEIFIRQSKRKAIANLIINPDSKDKPLPQSDFTDDDLLLLTNLEKLFREKKYEELIAESRIHLHNIADSSVGDRIASMLINAYIALRQDHEAKRVADHMDSISPCSSKWLLKKARLINAPKDKLEILELALSRDIYSSEALRALGRWHSDQCGITMGEARKQAYESAYDYFKKSIVAAPSKSNLAWSLQHELVRQHEKNKPRKNDRLNEIETTLAHQGALDWGLLNLKVERLDKDQNKIAFNQLVEQIGQGKTRAPKSLKIHFDRLLLRAHINYEQYDDAKLILDELHSSQEHVSDSGLAYDIAKAMRKNFAMDDLAASVLKDNLAADDFDATVFSYLFRTLLDISYYDEAKQLLDRFAENVLDTHEWRLRHEYHERIGDFASALDALEKREHLGSPTDYSAKSYLLLRQKKFNEAREFCQQYLTSISYTPEATTIIVNLEVARKHLKSKPDNGRLDAVIAYEPTDVNKAVVAALKDHKKEALSHIENQLKKDKTFRFDISRWPVFEEISKEPEYQRIAAAFKHN
ncbi:SIR2 family protein [Ottowia testudinis]|uniref:SIR2 family protein n=1 Tax=Ottowia testudinis TaxID=2816950 RepID=A0A975H1R5_9BURK|nr:SIR2 family protein [Ottowia testudinis]QTD44029.1 SIR2 family protein [Ottowia testudinis]